jgi:hypothetical protein
VGKGISTGTVSTNVVCGQTLVLLLGVLNACTNIVALDEGRCFMSKSFKVESVQMAFWAVAWLTHMYQN